MPRGAHDEVVEFHVEPAEGDGVGRFLHGRNVRAQGGRVIGGEVLGREAHAHAFQGEPQRDDLLVVRLGEVLDPGAPALVERDNAFVRELDKRLANGHAADAQLRGEAHLSNHGAFRDVAANNGPGDLFSDMISQRLAHDGLQGRRVRMEGFRERVSRGFVRCVHGRFKASIFT